MNIVSCSTGAKAIFCVMLQKYRCQPRRASEHGMNSTMHELWLDRPCGSLPRSVAAHNAIYTSRHLVIPSAQDRWRGTAPCAVPRHLGPAKLKPKLRLQSFATQSKLDRKWLHLRFVSHFDLRRELTGRSPFKGISFGYELQPISGPVVRAPFCRKGDE